MEERDRAADEAVEATSLGDLLRGFMISSIPRTDGELDGSKGRSIDTDCLLTDIVRQFHLERTHASDTGQGKLRRDMTHRQMSLSMAGLLEIINTQIDAVVGKITTPVLAASNALAMQLNNIADAYAGMCPDQKADVKMLDLDSNYIVLLDSLRRTRPIMYKELAAAALSWHDNPPPLLDQPAEMVSLAAVLVSRLESENAQAHGLCTPDVGPAVAAALSTAKPLPPDPDPAYEAAEAEAAEADVPT